MAEYKATYKLRATDDIFAALEENTVTLSTMKVGVRQWTGMVCVA